MSAAARAKLNWSKDVPGVRLPTALVTPAQGPRT
jgi:hypothetical protein